VQVPALQNSWVIYGSGYGRARYWRDAWGQVHLSGLVKSGSLPNVIHTLPVPSRPSVGRYVIVTISDAGISRVDVEPNGQIDAIAGGTGYFSLDGAVIHAEEYEYVAPTLLNSWANFGTGYNDVGYWRNPQNGTVRIRGMVKNGTPGASSVVFTLPASHYPGDYNYIFVTISNSALGRVDIQTDGDVVAVSGNTAWLSLDRVNIPTDISVWSSPTLLNSWVNYGGSQAPCRYWKDECGVVHLSGLIKNGTAGANAFVLPEGYRPAERLIFETISLNGSAVELATGINILAAGDVLVGATSGTAWLTLDGISFVAMQ